MVDESITEKIRQNEIRWISPFIPSECDAVEIIENTDDSKVDVVKKGTVTCRKESEK